MDEMNKFEFTGPVEPSDVLLEIEHSLMQFAAQAAGLATWFLNGRLEDEAIEATEVYEKAVSEWTKTRQVLVRRMAELLDCCDQLQHALVGAATILHEQGTVGARHDMFHALHPEHDCHGADE